MEKRFVGGASDLLENCRERGLTDTVVINRVHVIAYSGTEPENVDETIVAKRGSEYVQISASEYRDYLPMKRRFSIDSETVISESDHLRTFPLR